MFVIYVAYSIAGWVALSLLLAYWMGVAHGRRLERGKSSTPAPAEPFRTNPHEIQR